MATTKKNSSANTAQDTLEAVAEAQKKTSTYTLGLWSKHQMSKDRDALLVKDHYQNVYCWRRVA